METFEFHLISSQIEEILQERNIFKDPYQSTGLKIGATLVYLAVFPVVFIIYKFINKEIEDQNKTIFNLLLACNYSIVILYLTALVGLDLAVAWFGPFPALICQMENIAKGTLLCCFFGTLYSLFVLRFFHIVVWSRMKIINDYLLAAIIINTSFVIGKYQNSYPSNSKYLK